MRVLLGLLYCYAAFGEQHSGSYLGVAVMEIDQDRAKALKLRDEHGVEINFVEKDSPAAKAGLKPEDFVLEFNGQRVEGTAQFIRMISEMPAGRKAMLGIQRAGQWMTVTVVLEARAGHEVFLHLGPLPTVPPAPPTIVMPDLPRTNLVWRTAVLGVETQALNAQMAEFFGVKQGVLVWTVFHDSAAARAGLKAGDVIVKAAGKPVAATAEISQILRVNKPLPICLMRNHKEMCLDVLVN